MDYYVHVVLLVVVVVLVHQSSLIDKVFNRAQLEPSSSTTSHKTWAHY